MNIHNPLLEANNGYLYSDPHLLPLSNGYDFPRYCVYTTPQVLPPRCAESAGMVAFHRAWDFPLLSADSHHLERCVWHLMADSS